MPNDAAEILARFVLLYVREPDRSRALETLGQICAGEYMRGLADAVQAIKGVTP